MLSLSFCRSLSRNFHCKRPLLNVLRTFSSTFIMSSSSDQWKSVLEYWVGIPNRPFNENAGKWFRGGEAVDKEIKEKFITMIEEASAGGLMDWEEDIPSSFALILLLDQFTRNVYRGKAEAFAGDDRAFRLAQKIAEGPWKESHKSVLSVQERVFAYMPYMHHESREAQAKCVDLYTEFMEERKGTDDEPRIAFNVNFAKDHQFIVDKFGRFPARNPALGRENTPEEEAFFKETGDKYKW